MADGKNNTSVFCDLSVLNVPKGAKEDPYWFIRVGSDNELHYVDSSDSQDKLLRNYEPSDKAFLINHYDNDLHMDMTDFKKKVWELNVDNDVFQYNIEANDVDPSEELQDINGRVRISAVLEIQGIENEFIPECAFWYIAPTKDGVFDFAYSDNVDNIWLDKSESSGVSPDFMFVIDTYDPYMEIKMNEYKNIIKESLNKDEPSL